MEATVDRSDTFDCQSASSLFWDVLPVERCRPDRGDAFEQLTFRLLLGSSGKIHGNRLIRMYIFSEADFHELYTLDISEEDFQTLKNDQGILVDFSKFADKLVDLLRKCIDAKGQDGPRFKAVLECCDGEWIFKLVETNDFKQIPHICLTFRRGDNHSVHCFLALRASELKVERDKLSETVVQQELELKQTRQTLSDYTVKVQMMDLMHTEGQAMFDGQIKDLQASTHCELVKQREDLIFAYERYCMACLDSYVFDVAHLTCSHRQAIHMFIRQQKYYPKCESCLKQRPYFRDMMKVHEQYKEQMQKLQTKLIETEAKVNELRNSNAHLCNEKLSLQHASCEHGQQRQSLNAKLTALQAQLDETLWCGALHA